MMPRFLALAAVLLLAVAPPAAAQSAGGGLYVVQAGDTLFRIARTNGLSIDELKALNGLADNTISVGQTLRLSAAASAPAPGTVPAVPTTAVGVGIEVPGTPTPDPPGRGPDAASDAVHVVTPGETLFRIAMRYDTSVDALRRLNGIRGDQIEVGQRLVVGRAGGTASGPAPEIGAGTLNPTNRWAIDNTTVPADLVHYVEPGETLYSIAALRGVALSALVANNALTTAPLEAGQILYLPQAARPRLDVQPLPPLDDSGLALVYPDVMAGRQTASGEAYDPLAFTASHRSLPFGTVLLVTNPTSGRTTFVRVIDRGPVSQAYLIELSAAAASALELDPNAARRVDLRRMP